MSKVAEKILSIYDEVGQEELTDELVYEAKSLITDFEVHDTKSLFYEIAALNLLNRAVKEEKYKGQLFYGIIKSKTSQIVDDVIRNPNSYDETKYYYDQQKSCLYISIYDVVFSFHQVQETLLILKEATKCEPIIWPGIMLQRISGHIFLIAKKMYNAESRIGLLARGEKNIEEVPHAVLTPCPDCGKMISPSAQFCPHCGWTNGKYANAIFDTLCIGNDVKISYRGNISQGSIRSMQQSFIELSLNNGGMIRIRPNAVDSVEVVASGTLASQADSFFTEIFEIAKIDTKSQIHTNSTIVSVTLSNNKTPFTVLTDNGERIECMRPVVGYKKKNCQVGDRIYCGNIDSKNRTYNSIFGMSYGELMKHFKKAVSRPASSVRFTHRATALGILSFLNNDLNNNIHVTTRIAEFKAKTKYFFDQFSFGTTIDNQEDIETIDKESANKIEERKPSEISNVENKGEGKKTGKLYRTEIEKDLVNGDAIKLNVLGKISLDTIQDKRKAQNINQKESAAPKAETPIKPAAITSEETKNFLRAKRPLMTEGECKIIEKELDKLIRNGQKEECLQKSYATIEHKKPTPKYFRSYLDRIVNTEIALGHFEQAEKALAILISFSEKQSDVNDRGLSHLYISMGRVYIRLKQEEEALKALNYAGQFHINEGTINKLKESISSSGSLADKKGEDINSTGDTIHSGDGISKMLIQDVENKAREQEVQQQGGQNSALDLYNKAQNNRENINIPIAERSDAFLASAAAFVNSKQTKTLMYQVSVANYARLRGQEMYIRFAELVKNYDAENLAQLYAFRDSACCYFLEALGIYNILGEKTYLQELFLKYLQLSIVVSSVEGGKTPDQNWGDWTLKQLQRKCVKGNDSENQHIFFETCVSVGAAAEGAWNTLYQDEDGLGLFMGAIGKGENKEHYYKIFNNIEHSSIASTYSPGEFLRKIFEHRKGRIITLQDILDDMLRWGFSLFEISSFKEKWCTIKDYQELLTSTDIKVYDTICSVLDI